MSTPSALAQAIATAASNSLVAYNPTLTGLQLAISGGNLAYAATVDGFSAVTFTEVQGGVGFAGTWVNFGGSVTTVGYFKDIFGFVHLKGTAKSGTINTTMFTLPSGYLPAGDSIFPCASNGAYGQININASTGVVTPQIGSNVFISLDGISFLATH